MAGEVEHCLVVDLERHAELVGLAAVEAEHVGDVEVAANRHDGVGRELLVGGEGEVEAGLARTNGREGVELR